MSSAAAGIAPSAQGAPGPGPVRDISGETLDLLPAAAFVCDRDGVILCHNRRAAELWGRAPRPGDPSERFCGSFPMADVLRTGISVRDQAVVIERPDGSRIVAVVSIDALRDDTGAVIGAINCFQDATALRSAETPMSGNEQLLRDMLGALPTAVYTTDAEGRITYFNAAAVELSGRTPQLGTDRWCVTWRLYRPDGSPLPHDECPMAVALKEGRPIRGAAAIAERPDGTRVHFIAYPTPLFDSSGKLVGAVNMLVDITERRRSDEMSHWLAAIVQSSDDAIVSKTLDGLITSWNQGAERIFGYSAEEAIGRPISLIIPEDYRTEETEILARVRRGDRVDNFETVRRRKDGTLVTISLTVSPVRDSDDRIVGASKIARDITAQKAAEERVQLLAREVDHRSNNLLATVQAILRLTRTASRDDYVREVSGRVAALAKAHKLIGEGGWSGADFRRLVSEELLPYGIGGHIRVVLTGPEFSVNARMGQGLALVVHELATNSAKYGALSVPSGTVSIEWSMPSASEVRVRWIESGGPPVKAPTTRGFGTGLIEAVVTNDLGGALSFDWRSDGLLCEFSLSRGVEA